MALQEYLGAIVMEVDGQEVEIESVDVTEKTGRKLVKTMNKTGRAKGFAKGIAEYDLKVTAVIPLTGDLDWAAIEGAKITIYPLSAGGKRESYLDCFTLEVGKKYTVDGEAKQDLSMAALRKVNE
ncbi:phage tail protein [Methylophilus sp. YYY-1]|uniref:phage tail protein n=1 Tax=Methylophilus sp. YYY-1 TaxID=2682087 RepID=UPI0023B25C78|nr:phage tail protein [Methylophilus sp. YYY-1]MDF0377697.1 phage tail protein [Methylophilus sp. YYY-1]